MNPLSAVVLFFQTYYACIALGKYARAKVYAKAVLGTFPPLNVVLVRRILTTLTIP